MTESETAVLPPPGGYVRPEGWESYDEGPRGAHWPRFAAELEAGIEAALAGDPAGARSRFDAAAAALEPGGHFGRLLLGVNRAQALLDAGDLPSAEAEAAAALRLARREKKEHWTALANLALGLVHIARGRRGDARARLSDALRGFAQHGDRLRLIQCHFLLGEIAYLGEDIGRAGKHYREGAAAAREAGEQEWVELLSERFDHR